MIVALAVLLGFGIGVVAWCLGAHSVAVWLNWLEDKNPALIGSRSLRSYEAVACGFVFAASLALAIWLSRVLWLQMN